MNVADQPTLVVSEIFGPTWQGEGPSLGTRAAFVRLGRCNLACTWCDTPFTWRWTDHDPAVELTRLSVSEIIARVDAIPAPLVVVTGGEPLLQQTHLPALLGHLKGEGRRIEIETAGTLAPLPTVVAAVDRFNVSPKLENSGNRRDRRYRPEVLAAFVATGRAAFKFVVTNPADLEEIAAIVEDCAISPGDVWVMPEGVDADTLIARSRELAEATLARGWNMTTRLHVLLWGDERGR